jgi:acyl dehydratase/NAD(P)-dependent dehydrogenase (short-subunit alcohol dehydrogenase family)
MVQQARLLVGNGGTRPPSELVLARRTFTPQDQKLFATLSGDFNPMHVDPLAARRTQFGAPVVHGMHMVLWCLDVLARCIPDLASMTSLQARFSNPIYAGDALSIVVKRQSSDAINLRLQADETTIVTIRIRLGASPPAPAAGTVDRSPGAERPFARDIAFEDMAELAGMVRGATSEIAKAFSAAAAWVGAVRLAGLAAISTVVGMECPGLHSILSSIEIDCTDDCSPDIHYQVTETDPRFRIVRMRAHGCGLAGRIEAFARRPPVPQMSIADVATQVGGNEFTGQKALIVGGSRGLGALTAKIIAAGGGQSTISYAVGETEANEIAREINGARPHSCNVIRYDATEPAAPQLASLKTRPTHLYYFATSRIFRRKRTDFDADLFKEYLNLYVFGFHELCQALATNTPGGLRVFLPSSSAVSPDDRPAGLTEYAMAKMSAETLCADMARLIPGVRVVSKRLPRLLTDQVHLSRFWKLAVH